MLIDFMNRLFSSSGKLELKTPASVEVLAGDESKEEPAVTPESKYEDPEIEILSKHLGPFEPGQVFEVALTDMLQWLPRNRKKSDAYKSLCRRLATMGIELKVSSSIKPREYGTGED